MNDLFEGDERFRKGGGKVPSPPPSGRKGKGKGSEPSQGGGKVPDPFKYLPLAHPKPDPRKGRRPENEAGLRGELAAVYRDLEEANGQVEAVAPIASQYAMAFTQADLALKHAIAQREMLGGPRYVFEFYDARVAAGHAWHPHRQRLNDALRWRKALMDAAQAINKELGQ